MADQPSAGGPARPRRSLPWRAGLAGQLILLAALLVLGMAANLFVRIPSAPAVGSAAAEGD